MNIESHIKEQEMLITVEGRLDSLTAPDLVKQLEIFEKAENVNKIVFDFSNLQYISSAGLRTILMFRKRVKSPSDVILKNAGEAVLATLTVTGFEKLITLK